MDEKYHIETIKDIGNAELFDSIIKQDNLLASLPNRELEDFKLKNSHYVLTNGSVSLEYYGAKHKFDPGDTQFKNIEESFASYLEGKNLSRIVVLVEGSIPTTSGDIEQDIHQTGERGFITHLAREKGIEVACLEPDREVELKYLLEEFKPEQIEYYYYLRAIRDYFRPGRIQREISFEDFSKQVLGHHKDMFANVEEFSDFDFSLDHMKRIHKDLTGNDFDKSGRPDINPRRNNTVINKISKACSTFRDFHHVRFIEKFLTDGFSVFVVNGEDHAVIQISALETIFGR